MYSWLRRSLSRSGSSSRSSSNEEEETLKLVAKHEGDEFYGVTDQLIEFVKTFTFDTFKNFSLPDEDGDETQTTSGGVRVDLSDWQQRHATVVLSKVKELSNLRYMLCPRHLKEREFWRIYFTLVKSYVTGHQLRAIQVDKLRKTAMENEKSSDADGIELEMTEARQRGNGQGEDPECRGMKPNLQAWSVDGGITEYCFDRLGGFHFSRPAIRVR